MFSINLNQNLLQARLFIPTTFGSAMAILSKGQKTVLDSGRNLDGGPSSEQYVRLIKRNVNLKVMEAGLGLRELFDEYPSFRPAIRQALSWFENESKPSKSPQNQNGDLKKPVDPNMDPSTWPDDPMASGTPVVIDRDDALRDL